MTTGCIEMTRIVSIAGAKGSGKSTVAEFLCAQAGFKHFSFASPMKEFVQAAFEFTDDQLYGPSSSREALDTRFTLDSPGRERVKQLLWQGKQYGYGFADAVAYYSGKSSSDVVGDLMYWFEELYGDARCWTPRRVLQTLGTEFGRQQHPDVWVEWTFDEIKKNAPGRAVISDARFNNEFVAVVKNGSQLWEVRRPNLVHTDSHSSEQDVHGPVLQKLKTYTIHNNQGIPELLDIVRTLV